MDERDWTRYAACRGADPQLFLPKESAAGHQVRPPVELALSYCRVCPVVAECGAEADAAFEYPMVGVWGGRYIGHQAAERRRMARKREREATA